MGIGTSLIVIAIGAVLRFAVYRQDVGGVSLGTVGVILLIVGVVGLIISVSLLAARRRTDVMVRREPGGYRRTYVEPGPDDPRYL
jgi:tetrahydromethanopterin S-methyltransferase subunit E